MALQQYRCYGNRTYIFKFICHVVTRARENNDITHTSFVTNITIQRTHSEAITTPAPSKKPAELSEECLLCSSRIHKIFDLATQGTGRNLPIGVMCACIYTCTLQYYIHSTTQTSIKYGCKHTMFMYVSFSLTYKNIQKYKHASTHNSIYLLF